MVNNAELVAGVRLHIESRIQELLIDAEPGNEGPCLVADRTWERMRLMPGQQLSGNVGRIIEPAWAVVGPQENIPETRHTGRMVLLATGSTAFRGWSVLFSERAVNLRTELTEPAVLHAALRWIVVPETRMGQTAHDFLAPLTDDERGQLIRRMPLNRNVVNLSESLAGGKLKFSDR